MVTRQLSSIVAAALLAAAVPALADTTPQPALPPMAAVSAVPAAPPTPEMRSEPVPAPPPAGRPGIVAAITNVLILDRPGQDGLATVWDGNKYIQCHHMSDRTLRCEAGGALMQPSLSRVLTQERVARLGELGWTLDPGFGNYVRVFQPDASVQREADAILSALRDGYGADLDSLETETTWIGTEPCPPRNGPRQNLAGLINAAPAMAATAVHACSYKPAPGSMLQPVAHSAQDLIDAYGARATGEVGRLRVNAARQVHIIFDTDVGYIQCAPDISPPSIYCEAASAESWPVLAGVLTAERLTRLHAAGFADPGRSPNFEAKFPFGTFDDATIARRILTVLYEVYGYNGVKKLRFQTE